MEGQILRALADSWFVSIVDPVWGRNDQLWPILAAALAERPAVFLRSAGNRLDRAHRLASGTSRTSLAGPAQRHYRRY